VQYNVNYIHVQDEQYVPISLRYLVKVFPDTERTRNPIAKFQFTGFPFHVSLHTFCLYCSALNCNQNETVGVPKEVQILDLFELLHITNILPRRPASTPTIQILSNRILNLCIRKARLEV